MILRCRAFVSGAREVADPRLGGLARARLIRGKKRTHVFARALLRIDTDAQAARSFKFFVGCEYSHCFREC